MLLDSCHSILPVRSKLILCATLLTVRLEDFSAFEAVSYAWGKYDLLETLNLVVENGITMRFEIRSKVQITRSIETALRAFRRKDTKRLLWIDAICINQVDLIEKSHQVSLMKHVYKQASQVLVWLGKDTEQTASAFDYIRELAVVAEQFDIKPRSHFIPLSHSELEGDPERFQKLIDAAGQSHIEQIYERTWFTRVWTVQEIALGAKASIQCGPHEVDWMILETAMTLLQAALSKVDGAITNPTAFNRVWNIIEIRGDYRALSGGRIELGTRYAELGMFVNKLRGQDCTDDRDRIYGVLGLRTSRLWLKELRVDYTLSAPEVFTEFTWWHLEAGDVEILLDAGIWERPQSNYELHKIPISEFQSYLPSWVPDFRKSSQPGWLSWRCDGFKFNASTDMSPKIKLSTKDKQKIIIKAQLLERVDLLVNIEKTLVHEVYVFLWIRKVVMTIREAFHKHFSKSGNPQSEGAELALARTLVADGASSSLYVKDIPRLWTLYEQLCLAEDGPVLQLYLDLKQNAPISDSQFRTSLTGDHLEAWIFHTHLQRALFGNCFFMTEEGNIGLAPRNTAPSDFVALIGGVRTPFIVRRLEKTWDLNFEEHYYLLVGPAFAHGIMYGESGTDSGYAERFKWMPLA